MTFNEDIFYINEQMKQNGSSLREYAIAMNKKQYVEFIGTRFNFDMQHTNGYYLINPAMFASMFYEYGTNRHDYTSDYAVMDYDLDNKLITAIGIDKDLLTYYDRIPLTAEETVKLQRARSLYMTSMQALGGSETNIYTTTPIHTQAANLRAGELKAVYKSSIITYYNAIRAGQGLAEVTQSDAAFTRAQHMAVLNSYITNVRGEEITHSPSRSVMLQDGVKESFYNTALGWGEESMGENIAWSNNLEPSTFAMRKYINQFIDDSSESTQAFSHRVSLLHPTNSYGGYGIAHAVGVFEFGHDSANGNGIDIVAWPSKGITLLETLDSYNFKWSTQFYNGYKVTENTQVQVTCLTDGKTWTFDTLGRLDSHYYVRFYQSGASELQNRVIFGDSSLVPQPGFVYQIKITGLKNASGSAVEYTYRSAFDYGDESLYGSTTSNITIDAKDNIPVPNTSKTYYVPIGEESDFDVILDNGVKDVKVTWTSTDSSITLTQSGTVIVPQNCAEGKTFKITVTSDTAKASDTITLKTYSKKGKITLNPSEDFTMKLDKNTEKKITVTSINGSQTGTVQWKIVDEQTPNVYYDIDDEKVSKYISVRTTSSDKEIYITAVGVPYTGNKFKIVAIATTPNGIFEGEVGVTLSNPVEVVRISSKLPKEGINYYVVVQTDTYSTLKCHAAVSKLDLQNEGQNKIGFKTTLSPTNATVSTDTNWEIIEGDNVISLANNNGDVYVNNYGVATLRATNIESGVYTDLILKVQEPLTNFGIAGSTANFAYYAETHATDQLTINRTPVDNFSDITFKSSNTNVASVDSNGLVSFKGVAGKVTITATCNDYTTVSGSRSSNTKTATFEYTVTVPVASLEFANKELDLNLGEYIQQSPTVNPSNISGIYSHITYTSSNTDVATVTKSGSVYGNAPGEATITATVDPTYANGQTITASYNVHVSNPIVSFTINGNSSMRDIEGPTTFTVTPKGRKTDYPYTDTYTLSWESDDPEIASVDSSTGVVTPKGKGYTYIRATLIPSYINVNGDPVERKPIKNYLRVTVTNVTVKLNCSKTNISAGESVNCTTTITPQITELSKHIIYSSSDESIATVNSSGRVTGKSAGTVKIKMEIDPAYTSGVELKDEITFVVTNHVKSASLEVPTLYTGDGSKKLSVTLTPQNTSDDVKITWKSSNTQIATIDPDTGVITPIKPGNVLIQATVIASYYDSNGTLRNSLSTVVSQNVNIVYSEKPKYLKGDLDRNNVVDANDASIALELNKTELWTQEDIEIGDMDDNNVIDANDASLILELYKINN